MTVHDQMTVADIVVDRPEAARVFEDVGIDYCCGGRRTLADACEEIGLDPAAVIARLEGAAPDAAAADPAALSLTELAAHIESTHHAYLWSELPRMEALADKVAAAHGERDARLGDVAQTMHALAADMSLHMQKEERVLFPMIAELDASDVLPEFHCGTLANPIRQMELEHSGVDGGLEQLRSLTDGFSAPDWACPTYRALMDAFRVFERDTHQHVHKENNVLFPRALARELELRGAA